MTFNGSRLMSNLLSDSRTLMNRNHFRTSIIDAFKSKFLSLSLKGSDASNRRLLKKVGAELYPAVIAGTSSAGGVLFHSHPYLTEDEKKWIYGYKPIGEILSKFLSEDPRKNNEAPLRIKGLDLSSTLIDVDELERMSGGMKHLEIAYFTSCSLFNDLCLFQLAASCGDSLRVLDVKNCPLITKAGLAACFNFQNLSHLDLQGNSQFATDKDSIVKDLLIHRTIEILI